MEHASIERELRIEATPEVVYKVISTPEHLQQWWPDEAELTPAPGATGFVAFGDTSTPDAKVAPLTVVEADPPRRFAFRWVYDEGQTAAPANSLLVTFELAPSGTGTLLRFTETGFTERFPEPAERERCHRDHVTGWDRFLPRLVTYAARQVSAA
ncbi:SRPBCC domain-containing protein [Nonomuraea turcica]|uniref:SRPBCC domain-containing protein n=1 Tax=Nonomuraea sp. G32 TaxID=3067274 RepID=UPI00273AB185|nr:SRPBCC domain-containing protein [Nonomuraea sp. G32]MDP4503946.1 SRPBCC domain-containing protein [Nonomuraea sp. G32]